MVYKWNAYNLPVKADVVGRELEALESEKGAVIPEDIVTRAKPKDSVLHPLFEWDNKKAAELYRVEQAKTVIRALILVDEEKKDQRIRAFVNVSEIRTKGVFINIRSALEDEETRAVVLGAAYNELKAFRQKYQTYTEFTRLFAEIDSLIEGNEE